MSDAKNEDSLFTSILVFLLVIPGAAWSGFVLARLWAWFVVPLGVPAIGTWHAAGLSVLVSWMTGVVSRNDGERTATESLVLMAFVPAIVWGIGALYHAFM
jgi:hypothetical protein